MSQEQEFEETGKIEYHQGFYAAMMFEYEAAPVEIQKELQLGEQPVRLDMLIIKLNGEEPLGDPIGRFFKKYNVIEYKSPEDSLSIDDFIKVQSYAGFYKSIGRNVNEIPLKALTVSLVRHVFPREMFSVLRDEGFTIEEASPGIFYIKGPMCFPTQVVVTSRLAVEDYEALKILTTGAKEADILKFVENACRTKNPHASAVLQVSMAANRSLYQKLKKEGFMMSAFTEIFHDELAEAASKGRSEGFNAGRSEERRDIRDILIASGMKPKELQDRLIAGGMPPQKAASFAGLTV